MLKRLCIALAVSTVVLSMTAHAGGAYVGKAKPWYYSNSLYIDIGQTTMSNRPTCATRTYVRLQEDDGNNQTDPIYKNKFAILLSAWMAQRNVSLSGTGNCTSEGDEIVFAVRPE